jgi:hypothetical protein
VAATPSRADDDSRFTLRYSVPIDVPITAAAALAWVVLLPWLAHRPLFAARNDLRVSVASVPGGANTSARGLVERSRYAQ